jgi:hypothetical protein
LVKHRARFRYWLSVGVKQRPTVADESMPAAVMDEHMPCLLPAHTVYLAGSLH